ncbi:hypothetical protein GWK47_001219 [Chionoecetes opilio]|uniref:Uncharacterized protein n=1 Tax=Chionoecetes opilio TaxID=41210 RepID=A0A8J5CNQ4_CHIOP|nr:hypothetical protein GWK47_001219 [Chionoecetes opilio]
MEGNKIPKRQAVLCTDTWRSSKGLKHSYTQLLPQVSALIVAPKTIRNQRASTTEPSNIHLASGWSDIQDQPPTPGYSSSHAHPAFTFVVLEARNRSTYYPGLSWRPLNSADNGKFFKECITVLFCIVFP